MAKKNKQNKLAVKKVSRSTGGAEIRFHYQAYHLLNEGLLMTLGYKRVFGIYFIHNKRMRVNYALMDTQI